MPTSDQACGVVAAGVVVLLLVIGATLLPTFTDDDQRLVLIVFAILALAASAWLVAFGPAFLVGVYILAITETSPGLIRVF